MQIYYSNVIFVSNLESTLIICQIKLNVCKAYMYFMNNGSMQSFDALPNFISIILIL